MYDAINASSSIAAMPYPCWCGLLRAGTVAAKPGGLLWEIITTIVTDGTAIAVAAAVASVAAIVECGLLL